MHCQTEPDSIRSFVRYISNPGATALQLMMSWRGPVRGVHEVPWMALRNKHDHRCCVDSQLLTTKSKRRIIGREHNAAKWAGWESLPTAFNLFTVFVANPECRNVWC